MAGDLTVRNIKVTDRIEPGSAGGTVTLGNSINADTIAVPSGVTLNINSGATFSATAGTMSGQNYPAFEAYLSSAQSISDAVDTKVQCDTEVFDTDNCYDNATNYRFTPTVAGKYLVYVSLTGKSGGDTQLTALQPAIYKNGSEYNDNVTQFYVNYIKQHTMFMSRIIDMNGSTDYVEFYGYVNVSTGTPTFSVDGTKSNFFGAYRIGS